MKKLKNEVELFKKADRPGATRLDATLGEWPDTLVAKYWARGRYTSYEVRYGVMSTAAGVR